MSFFTLRTKPGQRWPVIPDPGLSQIWAAYQALDRTQWLEPAELQRQQLVQFRELLDHCRRHVPFYREMLTRLGLESASVQSLDDLRTIPLLSRRTWQSEFERFRAEKLPPGTVELDEDRTSGTSGVPVRVLKTNVFYVWWLALYLRDLEWSDLRPEGTMASIRATLKTGEALERLLGGERMPSWSPILEPLLEGGPLYGMDLRQDPRRQLEWLAEVNPDYLLSHTSNLELLAGMLGDEPRRFPRLRAVQAVSETLTDEARRKIETAFAAPVRNLYSSAEAGYLASPCPSGQGLHVHAENVILEVLDERDQPCLPGQTGRVVLSVLHNFLTPFIRYDIGDLATLAPEPCSCGRGLPLLEHVQGKARPMFVVAGGRRKHASALIPLITTIGAHHQHQVVQRTADEVLMRIVPSRDWSPSHAERMLQAVREFFEGAADVRLEVCQRLEPLPGGKLQSMICEVPT